MISHREVSPDSVEILRLLKPFILGLNFSLRIYKEQHDSTFTGPEGRQRQVIYTPLELDKEDQAFVQNLDHLAQSFTFNASQLNVFLDSLNSTMDSALLVDEDGEE